MTSFQFYLKSGKLRNVGWVGNGSHATFGQKFPGKRGSVRQCVSAMQQPFFSSAKFFAHFRAVTIKCCSNMRNWLFGLPGWILCEQSFGCLRKWCACFDFFLYLSRLFWSVRVFPRSLPHSFQDLHEIWCSSFVGSITKLLQIRGSKKSAHPPNCVTFCTLTSKIC
jgi:hypothetical protein